MVEIIAAVLRMILPSIIASHDLQARFRVQRSGCCVEKKGLAFAVMGGRSVQAE